MQKYLRMPKRLTRCVRKVKAKNREIRKLIVGDVKFGLAYVKGQSYGDFKITKIIRDENSGILFGKTTYLIYAQKGDEPETIWKLFERQPIAVEYEHNIPANT